MSNEEETNKKHEKYQNTHKNVVDKNPGEQITSKPTNNSEIEKSKKVQDLKLIVVHDVIFNDSLPRYKIEVKSIIPELKTEIPGDIITKNVIFIQNIITLTDNSIRPVIVPDFNIYHPPKIEIRKKDFNVSLVKTVDISVDLTAAVPFLKTNVIKQLIVKNVSFNSTIMMEFKKFEYYKIQPIEQKPPDEPNHSGDSIMEFHWDMKLHNKIFFLGGISSGEGFKIIVVPDKEDYYEFVAMNFRDMYRIANGGYVYDVVRKKNIANLREDFGKQTARHEIIIVKIDDNIPDSDRNYLLNIIENKPYQDSGLIIMAVSNLEKFREEIGISDDVLILEESDFQPLLEKSKELTKIIRGFSDYPVSSGKFGDEFKNSVLEFDNKIEEYVEGGFIYKKLKGFDEAYRYFINNKDLLNATRNSSEKEASNIHSGMKSFIYVYERKNGIDDVKFEKDDTDVVAGEKYYEAETLFGRKDVTALLAEKMKKEGYRGGYKEIIFTFRNLDIIRNFYSFRTFLEQNKDSKIKICGFDFVHEKLVPMSKMIIGLK